MYSLDDMLHLIMLETWTTDAVYLALHFSVRIDQSSRPFAPARLLCVYFGFSRFYLPSPFSLSCLLCILHYCHFPLLPFAYTPTRRVPGDRRQSLDFSIFAPCIAMYKVARVSGTTRDFEMLKFSLRNLYRFDQKRNYLAGFTCDELHFEL